MTTEEKYKLAQWVIDHAVSKGAQQVRVSLAESRNANFEIREKKIDNLKQANQNGLSIDLYVDRRYSSHSTNRLKKEDLARFIEEAIAGTRYLAEDEFRALPDESLYYREGGPDLRVADSGYDSILPETKIEQAFQVESEVYEKDDRIISMTAYYSDNRRHSLMVTSNGFRGERESTYFGLSAAVTVDGGTARPESSWGESSLFYDSLKKTGIGQTALERALKKIGQKKIASAKLPMLLENRVVGRLFGPLVSAMQGASIYQKNSFLINKMGEKIASGLFSLTDDPFIPSGYGSRLFDSEGIATVKRAVLDNGVLKTFFIDTYYGKKLGMDPNSGDTTNLVFSTGQRTLQEMISSLKKGILVTGFTGGNCNGSTGDFSYGIDGFLIENGEAVQPVAEMNITGNMKEFWMQLAEMGNDAREDSSWRMPSLLFDKVDFSGI